MKRIRGGDLIRHTVKPGYPTTTLAMARAGDGPEDPNEARLSLDRLAGTAAGMKQRMA